jgi:hypothetical protein
MSAKVGAATPLRLRWRRRLRLHRLRAASEDRAADWRRMMGARCFGSDAIVISRRPPPSVGRFQRRGTLLRPSHLLARMARFIIADLTDPKLHPPRVTSDHPLRSSTCSTATAGRFVAFFDVQGLRPPNTTIGCFRCTNTRTLSSCSQRSRGRSSPGRADRESPGSGLCSDCAKTAIRPGARRDEQSRWLAAREGLLMIRSRRKQAQPYVAPSGDPRAGTSLRSGRSGHVQSDHFSHDLTPTLSRGLEEHPSIRE